VSVCYPDVDGTSRGRLANYGSGYWDSRSKHSLPHLNSVGAQANRCSLQVFSSLFEGPDLKTN